MRNHIQGAIILTLLLVAIWGAAKLAQPTLSDAFGEDGAVNADSGEDSIELTIDSTTLDADLTFEERTRLQLQLARADYLTAADIDGEIGPISLAAIAAAAEDWGLENPSHRAVLEHADELFADVPFFEDA